MNSFPIPNILSVITFLPLLGGLILLLPIIPRPKDLPEQHGGHNDHNTDHTAEKLPADPARTLVNAVAIIFSMLPFLLCVGLFLTFNHRYTDAAAGGIGRNMQYVENFKWITLGNIDIHYKMGIDGISLLLLLLTTFLMPLCVAYSTKTKQRLKEFMFFLLMLETGMIGVFCALDLVLFYFFWEAMLIPMYFLIGIFGHERRIYAAIKFFLYTFAGSIFMLIAIVAIYQLTGSFDLTALTNPTDGPGQLLRGANPEVLKWMFFAFALAFMIKVPMFPFHTWLPDAHVEAPTAGSVILAGVMLKMGTYGFIRFCIPLFPVQAQQYAYIFITLAVIGIVYGSIVAAVQPDAKKLVAYSSVAHLGFVMLGIFSFTQVGMMGALIQNINHGISTPMLFFLVGMLYDRRHTRTITEFGGLKLVTPMLATMLLLATLSSIAVPFFNGFVGEFTILQGSWMSVQTGFWTTAIAASGMILSAVYMLWWFQRLMLGPVTKTVNKHLPDLSRLEWAVLTPLVGIVFWIGLGSHYWTQRMDTSVEALLPYGYEQLRTDLPLSTKLEEERRNTLGNESQPLRPRRPAGKPMLELKPAPAPEGTGAGAGTGQTEPGSTGGTVANPNGAAPSSTTPPVGNSTSPVREGGENPASGGTQPNTGTGSNPSPDTPVSSPTQTPPTNAPAGNTPSGGTSPGSTPPANAPAGSAPSTGTKPKTGRLPERKIPNRTEEPA